MNVCTCHTDQFVECRGTGTLGEDYICEDLRDSICREFYECDYDHLTGSARKEFVNQRTLEVQKHRREREIDEGAIRIQASQINNLISERDQVRREYAELVDALCSPSWLGRNSHSSVVGLAKRLHDSQRQLYALDVTQSPKLCSRKLRHTGPCNGHPRNTCPGAQS